ncbi:BON domain-containing protein [Piscinibacter koreensis]|uniref:BON domain-containing protein n=1 Tax=Piscinibacter koreensis TaxID=2742824 RepID=A0A7Y6NJH4_9BURK|nr:BON domain-containing protein [Schlegelella koreensis]NUZ04333.1 BON domain-containing protein [Schlegelella koreensis]
MATCRIPRQASTLLAALVVTTGFSGCAPLLFGGAVVGGAMVATDRRTSGTQIDDQVLEVKIGSRLDDTFGERARINVTSFNRRVLLTGEIASEADKATATSIAERVDNVQGVVNELQVGELRSLPRRSGDILVEAKVKASLVDAQDIFANSVKVVAHQGVIYLMGRVSEREAHRATEIARGVSGVGKVVRVFEVMSDADLEKIRTRTPAP